MMVTDAFLPLLPPCVCYLYAILLYVAVYLEIHCTVLHNYVTMLP